MTDGEYATERLRYYYYNEYSDDDEYEKCPSWVSEMCVTMETDGTAKLHTADEPRYVWIKTDRLYDLTEMV